MKAGQLGRSTGGSHPVERAPQGHKVSTGRVFLGMVSKKSLMGSTSDLEVGSRAVLFYRIVVSSLLWFRWF